MKKIILFTLTILFCFTTVEAQIWNKIKDKAQKKAQEKIEQVLTKKEKKSKNSTIDKKKKTKSNNSSTSTNPIDIWRNYKFITGETIIFYDDLKIEEVGEFPTRWDLNEGGAEVAAYNGKKTIIGTSSHDNTIFPLFNSKNYLTDQFTIEFDVFVDELSKENNNSWGYYNLIFTNKHLNSDSRSIAEVEFSQRSGKTGGYVLKYDFQLEEVPLGELNAWHRVAISYNKGNFKLYYDENRIANIPKLAITPEIFALQMEGHSDPTFLDRKLNFGIRNIQIAIGGGKMYKRIVADGKYITHGIHFDVGESIIQPQSMGVINKFISILNENPDWNFLIVGHTDNTGDEASNLILSKKRAEAIKEVMVNNGIDKGRLFTDGKGESEPLNGNKTDEEKANNRRVEFIRK